MGTSALVETFHEQILLMLSSCAARVSNAKTFLFLCRLCRSVGRTRDGVSRRGQRQVRATHVQVLPHPPTASSPFRPSCCHRLSTLHHTAVQTSTLLLLLPLRGRKEPGQGTTTHHHRKKTREKDQYATSAKSCDQQNGVCMSHIGS